MKSSFWSVILYTRARHEELFYGSPFWIKDPPSEFPYLKVCQDLSFMIPYDPEVTYSRQGARYSYKDVLEQNYGRGNLLVAKRLWESILLNNYPPWLKGFGCHTPKDRRVSYYRGIFLLIDPKVLEWFLEVKVPLEDHEIIFKEAIKASPEDYLLKLLVVKPPTREEISPSDLSLLLFRGFSKVLRLLALALGKFPEFPKIFFREVTSREMVEALLMLLGINSENLGKILLKNKDPKEDFLEYIKDETPLRLWVEDLGISYIYFLDRVTSGTNPEILKYLLNQGTPQGLKKNYKELLRRLFSKPCQYQEENLEYLQKEVPLILEPRRSFKIHLISKARPANLSVARLTLNYFRASPLTKEKLLGLILGFRGRRRNGSWTLLMFPCYLEIFLEENSDLFNDFEVKEMIFRVLRKMAPRSNWGIRNEEFEGAKDLYESLRLVMERFPALYGYSFWRFLHVLLHQLDFDSIRYLIEKDMVQDSKFLFRYIRKLRKIYPFDNWRLIHYLNKVFSKGLLKKGDLIFERARKAKYKTEADEILLYHEKKLLGQA